MKTYVDGDRVRAICDYCAELVEVEFRTCEYVTDVNDRIPNVMQGFCTECGERLLLPPQSSQVISQYFKDKICTINL